jgi:spermidine synthase
MSRRILGLTLLSASLVPCFSCGDEKILFEKQSPYNLIVVTEDEQGLRTLRFERHGVRQSVVKVGDPDHLELPYARAMFAGLAFCDNPRRALIVGLGGGTLPAFLHKHYPQTVIDVVDIDPGVVQAARTYFGFREDQTLRAHVADGRRFIEQAKAPYDMVLLDAFGAENIPYHLATQEFLRSVRRATAPTGIVVANIWSRGSNLLYDSMVRTYQEVFEDLYILQVQSAGNEILLALPRKHEVQRDELAQQARAISKEKAFRFDLGDVVTYGFTHAKEKNARGHVLKDQDR